MVWRFTQVAFFAFGHVSSIPRWCRRSGVMIRVTTHFLPFCPFLSTVIFTLVLHNHWHRSNRRLHGFQPHLHHRTTDTLILAPLAPESRHVRQPLPSCASPHGSTRSPPARVQWHPNFQTMSPDS
ncbi:hypothetical protein IWX90DRAFT_296417 [Phyllosticta citrichinensis]|uniref:Secreted protein n=1 Tax=Phyllosticta citrichinensis TaxID=1130410 RepID=A0ABR1XKE1_9PEZI